MSDSPSSAPPSSAPQAPKPAPVIEELVLPDVAAWRAWLDENESTHDGVWLVLAKKGFTDPTSMTYAEALDEALCSGWIDGQKRSRDAATHLQRFTPRRARSLWSQRNQDHVARLEGEERMRERGRDEVARAQGDGRWEAAYAGSATAQPSAELAAALAASPRAAEVFDGLTGSLRYSVIWRSSIQRTPAGREKAAARMVELLEQGEPPKDFFTPKAR